MESALDINSESDLPMAEATPSTATIPLWIRLLEINFKNTAKLLFPEVNFI